MWKLKIAAPNPVKSIQAITMISQMIRNTVQNMKMKDIGLYFVILEKHFRTQIKIYLSRCVANEKCDGLLQVRGADLICEDTSLKCCYNSSLTETDVEKDVITDDYNPEVEICSEYENEGYR